MLEMLRFDAVDLVIGTRYAQGGSVGEWTRGRALLSRLATALSGSLVGVRVSDPMSGFFMIRWTAFERVSRRLSGRGFKILLDILTSGGNALRYRELPFVFRVREHGQSKLDAQVVVELVALVVEKRSGGLVSGRFALFSLVGATGVRVHMASLWVSREIVGLSFTLAQAVATMMAMTNNYLLNNSVAFRDRRRRGWALLRGLSWSARSGTTW